MRARGERGTSLIETLIATAICTTVVFAIAGLVMASMRQNKNQGATVAQATTLAAQQLDYLMESNFTCTSFTTPGVCGTTTFDTQLTAGGSLDSDIVAGSIYYYDYLDVTGTVPSGTTDPPGLASTDVRQFFTRRWVVQDCGTPTSTNSCPTASGTVTQKLITVWVAGKAVSNKSSSSSGTQTSLAYAPNATVASYKVAQ